MRNWTVPAVLLTALFLLGALPPGARAQEAERPRSLLLLGSGPGWMNQRDLHASPLRYRGGASSFQAAFRRGTGSRFWEIRLQGDLPGLTSEITEGSDHQEEGIRLAFQITRAAPIGERSSADRGWWWGPRFGADAAYRRHEYTWGLAEQFVDAFFWFGPAAGHHRRIGEGWRLEADVAAALFGITFRTPYPGLKYAPDPELDLPPDLLLTGGGFAILRTLGPRTSLRGTWRLQLLRHEGTFLLSRVHQVFGVGLQVRLGGGIR